MATKHHLWIVVLAAWIGAGCASSIPYVWIDDLPHHQEDTLEYRIAPRDRIAVRVWNHEAMSVSGARVREDGKISLPFLQDVRVAGLTPRELSDQLRTQLINLIIEPVVTVSIEEPALISISMLGEVARPGSYTMPRPAGLLHAIAAAGGLTTYADDDGIYVLRRLEPTSVAPMRIRFRYRDLTSGGTPAAGFLLQSGDVILVD